MRFEQFIHLVELLLRPQILYFVLLAFEDLRGPLVERHAVLVEFIWVDQSGVRSFPIDVRVERALAHFFVLLLALELLSFFLFPLVFVELAPI